MKIDAIEQRSGKFSADNAGPEAVRIGIRVSDRRSIRTGTDSSEAASEHENTVPAPLAEFAAGASDGFSFFHSSARGSALFACPSETLHPNLEEHLPGKIGHISPRT
jgi:hypothetical protein